MNPYHYQSGELQANLKLKRQTPRWRHYSVDFPSAHPTCYEQNNTVRGEYFQTEGETGGPLAILVHGMGDHSTIPCRFLARSLLKSGISCLILYLVLHSSRMPPAVRGRLSQLSAEEWFEWYQISVTDIRQVIDWASLRPELNREQIGVVGISFGGFISAIAMAIDQRIGAGVFLVAGGNTEKIAQHSRLKAIGKRYRRPEAEYNEAQRHYARYLEQVAAEGFENVTPARPSFLTDPMTFAPYLRERPVFMVNARWDEFIPREATLDFWTACGQPAISWFAATHTSIWLYYPLISRRVVGFLRKTFGMPDHGV